MHADKLPWYRHPWPWFVMSGPAIVVVAGLGTAVIAVRTPDSIVTEDYYRQGLTVNRVLVRGRHATEIGLSARLAFDGPRVRVELPASAPASGGLSLSLMHPALASGDEDEIVALEPQGSGRYAGTRKGKALGVVRIVLEDREGAWRLEGAMRDSPASLTLGNVRP